MDFKQRLEQSRNRFANGELTSEADMQACPYFATDRSRNPLCLDLRLPDGIRRAVPYAYFTEINFDADAGIEILTAQKRIHIIGRQLGMLYDHLIAYRVRYVQSNIGSDANEDGLFVKEIVIEEITG